MGTEPGGLEREVKILLVGSPGRSDPWVPRERPQELGFRTKRCLERGRLVVEALWGSAGDGGRGRGACSRCSTAAGDETGRFDLK